MRLLTCLTDAHNPWFVLLAAAMCIVGSWVTVRLLRRTLAERGISRYLWSFLSAVTAGSAIWATHFIAMLGYQPGVPVSFNGTLTIFSALVAVLGTGIGMILAGARNRVIAAICGGGTIGLAIAAMHYVGMFAYRADGIVTWLPAYIISSIIAATTFSAAAVYMLRDRRGMRGQYGGTALLVAAIILLHFAGMAGFSVTPVPGVEPGADSDAFSAMAAAVAMVALMIVGTGIATHLVEHRTRSESRDRLHHIAMHDTLTGLANRHSFMEALKAESEGARNDAPFALLLVDLDRFKPVNDTLGHPTGDELLRKVAGRLQCAVRRTDLVARIGGDEFAVIARGVSNSEVAETLASRIVEVLSRPFIINGNVAEIGGSVGVAFAPVHGNDAQLLTQRADIALYTAKRQGRSRSCLFDTAFVEEIERRRFLEVELRRACMREDFRIVYQPIIDTVTGAYTGAEALLRWNCPTRGDVPPSEFVPIAEELGLVSRIGALVLRQACMDAASWPDNLDIAVNVSPVQLLDPRLPQMVQDALNESGLAAHRLELEITETALLGNDDLAERTLAQLTALGVRISLDDFGTGYSSLSYLHRFPISRIKIDKSFVQRLPSDLGSVSIVQAIAQLGSSLGMKVTAEGIETREQLAFIADHGCDHVQGYLVSRPIEAGRIADVFAKPRKQEAA